jgi:hypothetical protein
MNEDYLFLASATGIALFLTSWVWLVMVSWRRRPAWGWAVLVFPPAGLLFAINHFPAARRPFILGLIGLAMTAGPPIANRLLPVDLGPRDTLVDGERHVTLTGWNRQDYGLLIGRSDIVVLQMANPDVNDETLRLLGDLTQLRELDLNNTKVTDSGLALLTDLPALERLRLAHTQISERGFREHLMPHPNLVELDLRGTEVTKDTVSEWRAAKPGRRALR